VQLGGAGVVSLFFVVCVFWRGGGLDGIFVGGRTE